MPKDSFETGAAKCCSSTPAAKARWWIARTANSRTTTSPASPGTYHAWRNKRGRYLDVPGFCKSATLDDIRTHDHILTPGRYVGAAPQPEDDEPFEDKMTRLAAEWREQQKEARRLDRLIAKNLAALGFGPEIRSAR